MMDSDTFVAFPMPKRGSIRLRLRVEWKGGESSAMKLYLTPPPRYIVNVDNEKAYFVLCYTIKGAVRMNEASIESVKILLSEVLSYWDSLCFLLDVVLGVLLWRGRLRITKTRTIWFPIHSVVVLASVVTLIERQELVFPVLLYYLAWLLLSINYHESGHPNPWKRVPWSLETNTLLILGRRNVFSGTSFSSGTELPEISPGQGAEDGSCKEKLDELKSKRMSALIHALLNFMLKVLRIYSKTSDSSVEITTNRKKWHFLSGKLYYVHLLLKMIVTYLRAARSFLSWQSTYTAVLTTNCIVLATIWIIFPMNTILLWIARILAWTCLGPWMKLVDIKYFRPWYETKEELMESIQNGRSDYEPCLPDLDSFLDSDTFCKLSAKGREKAEELVKLRDLRNLMFGAYSEAIPFSDTSRYPCVPLPKSTAVRAPWVVPPHETSRGYHIPGQHLAGNMVPRLERLDCIDGAHDGVYSI
jgi:hypothetical protein